MNLVDRLGHDPLGAAASCLVWVPVLVWVVTMVGWMVTGDVEPVFGVLSVSVALALGFLTVNPPFPRLSPFLLFATVLMVVAYPVVRAALNRQALIAIDIEQMERYHDTLTARPENSYAAVKLAEMLYVRGLPGHAIALADRYLPAMPESLFRAEHSMVNAWKMRPLDPGLLRPAACLRCGHENPLGQVDCEQCGSPYLMELARGKWLGGSSFRHVVAGWLGLMIALVGLPYAAMLAQTTPVWGLVLMGLLLLTGGFVVVRGLLGGRA